MDARLCAVAASFKLGMATLLLAFIFSGLPDDRSSSVAPHTLQVAGNRLIPTWVRLLGPGNVHLAIRMAHQRARTLQAAVTYSSGVVAALAADEFDELPI